MDLRVQLLGMEEMLQRSLRGDMEVKITFPDEPWPVDVDPGELELAILNICVNSRDAMPDGGTISISTRNGVDAVTLSITDTGVGMTKDVLARAFEPFFTTKDVGKGSGLGLAQVYGFVAQSNGEVSIESVPGKGTTVSLRFPRSENPVAEAESDNHGLALHSGNRPDRRSRPRAKVLLVEDDLTIAGLTSQMLESIGLTVVHVKSAAAALDALAEARDIDIVFSDVMMPGGMNGVELAREIRKRSPDLPIVLTTGYIEMARSAVTEGLEVLVKPYPLEVLSRTLMAHLSQRAVAVR